MKKIFVKSLIISPFYIIIALLVITPILGFNWALIIVAGLVKSAIYIGSNVFDYDHFNDIDEVDYLESKHTMIISADKNQWNNILGLLENVNIDYKIIDNNESLIKYELVQKWRINSTLSFIKKQDNIEVRIIRNYLSLVPDRAVNLKVLKRIRKQIEKFKI